MLKILAVDDTEANLKLLKMYIKRMGHDVITASDGQEAVDVYRQEKPDLILMDVMMNVMDGFEAAEYILNQHSDRWVPIIFLSAAATEEYFYKGMDIGCYDYLFKPINQKLLGAKINNVSKIIERQKSLLDENARLKSLLKGQA